MANFIKEGIARSLITLPGGAALDPSPMLLEVSNLNQISFNIFYTPSTAGNSLNYKVQRANRVPNGTPAGGSLKWTTVAYIEAEALTPGTDQVNKTQKLIVSYGGTSDDVAGNSDGFTSPSFIVGGSWMRIVFSETVISGAAGTVYAEFTGRTLL